MWQTICKSIGVVSLALCTYSTLLYLLLASRPNLILQNEKGLISEVQPTLYFPTCTDELKALVSLLQQYKDLHYFYLLALFSAAYIYKQTFAIPGSALMNILAGAILGPCVAVPLVCVLTAVGASCCYLLSRLSLTKILLTFQSHRVQWLRDKMSNSDSSLLLLLVSLRVFPGTPNWFLNVASPVADVPFHLFFLSVLIGLAPYNALCVLAGSSVSQLQSLTDLWSVSSLSTLLLIAVLAYIGSRVAANATVQAALETSDSVSSQSSATEFYSERMKKD